MGGNPIRKCMTTSGPCTRNQTGGSHGKHPEGVQKGAKPQKNQKTITGKIDYGLGGRGFGQDVAAGKGNEWS